MDEDKNEKIEVQILSPSHKTLYYNVTTYDIFDFNTTEAGTYTIIFDNRFTNSDVRVTFTMNTGHNTVLKKDDLNVTDAKATGILDFMSKYSLQFKMRDAVHSSRYASKIEILI